MMKSDNQRSQQIQQLTGLQPNHFADLVRAAQLICDPTGGLSGRTVKVNWATFNITPDVLENLTRLGKRYQYASPYIAIDVIWEQLTPASRNWLIENKRDIWKLEEMFPARDED